MYVLTYFPKVGLCDLHAVYESPPPFKFLNFSTNLKRGMFIIQRRAS
jgi:hypothetical protein